MRLLYYTAGTPRTYTEIWKLWDMCQCLVMIGKKNMSITSAGMSCSYQRYPVTTMSSTGVSFAEFYIPESVYVHTKHFTDK